LGVPGNCQRSQASSTAVMPPVATRLFQASTAATNSGTNDAARNA
jgi:hypothetical protein